MTDQQCQALEAFFVHADEGVVVIDAQGRVAMVNKAWLRMSGLTREQVVGQSVRELPSAMGMTDADAFIKWLVRSVRERHPASHLCVQVLVPERTMLVTSLPVYGPDGTFAGQVLVFRESGSLGTETVLELIADTAYELNQPMTVVLGLGQLIRRQIVAGHPLARDLLTLEQNIQRMSEIVRKLGRIVQYHRSSAALGTWKPDKMLPDNRLFSHRSHFDR